MRVLKVYAGQGRGTRLSWGPSWAAPVDGRIWSSDGRDVGGMGSDPALPNTNTSLLPAGQHPSFRVWECRTQTRLAWLPFPLPSLDYHPSLSLLPHTTLTSLPPSPPPYSLLLPWIAITLPSGPLASLVAVNTTTHADQTRLSHRARRPYVPHFTLWYTC